MRRKGFRSAQDAGCRMQNGNSRALLPSPGSTLIAARRVLESAAKL